MPIKSNIVICEKFLDIMRNHGIWEQVRSDQGTESVFIRYVQEQF